MIFCFLELSWVFELSVKLPEFLFEMSQMIGSENVFLYFSVESEMGTCIVCIFKQYMTLLVIKQFSVDKDGWLTYRLDIWNQTKLMFFSYISSLVYCLILYIYIENSH